VVKSWTKWNVWALTAVWGYLAMGISCFVFLMWLLCIWSVGYAALPVIQWLDPCHLSPSSNTPNLLYSCFISKCHHQLPYSHSRLWGMFLYLLKSSFLPLCNCFSFLFSLISILFVQVFPVSRLTWYGGNINVELTEA